MKSGFLTNKLSMLFTVMALMFVFAAPFNSAVASNGINLLPAISSGYEVATITNSVEQVSSTVKSVNSNTAKYKTITNLPSLYEPGANHDNSHKLSGYISYIFGAKHQHLTAGKYTCNGKVLSSHRQHIYSSKKSKLRYL